MRVIWIAKLSFRMQTKFQILFTGCSASLLKGLCLELGSSKLERSWLYGIIIWHVIWPTWHLIYGLHQPLFEILLMIKSNDNVFIFVALFRWSSHKRGWSPNAYRPESEEALWNAFAYQMSANRRKRITILSGFRLKICISTYVFPLCIPRFWV